MTSSPGKRHGGGGGWPFFTAPYSSDIWTHGGGANISGREDVNVDWRESLTAHIFTVDLPGVRKEDLKVEIEGYDNILHISGNRDLEKEQESDQWHRVECRRGSFLRRFRLPENAELDGMKCGLGNGVLRVEVIKKEVVLKPPRSVNMSMLHELLVRVVCFSLYVLCIRKSISYKEGKY